MGPNKDIWVCLKLILEMMRTGNDHMTEMVRPYKTFVAPQNEKGGDSDDVLLALMGKWLFKLSMTYFLIAFYTTFSVSLYFYGLFG